MKTGKLAGCASWTKRQLINILTTAATTTRRREEEEEEKVEIGLDLSVFSIFAREKRNKEHETGLEKEKNVSLRWRMPSLLLSVYSRAGYGPKDQDWTNGLDVATGWGSRRKKKRERIRVRRRHRSKRRRTGRGRWLVALTGGRLRRLYRSVSDSASSRVSLCVCVSFRFFFFCFYSTLFLSGRFFLYTCFFFVSFAGDQFTFYFNRFWCASSERGRSETI